MRIIADHIRTATFMLGDENGIVPSNVDQGYVLRRLIRRSVRFARQLGIEAQSLVKIADLYVEQYKGVYEELVRNSAKINEELVKKSISFPGLWKTVSNNWIRFCNLSKAIRSMAKPRSDFTILTVSR